MIRAFVLTAIYLALPSAWAVQAQPVPIPEEHSTTPEVVFSGTGVATLNYSNAHHGEKRTQVNFSDSALLVGAAQRLHGNGWIGSTGLGWLTLDETNEGLGTQLFLNQAFLNVQGERFEVLVGRSDQPHAHLVDFPTVRGDDLVTLTNPLSPFSNGHNAEEHRYSNVASATWNWGLRHFANFHVQHQIASAGLGSATGINSFGATFESLADPGMEAFARVPHWGLAYERHLVNSGIDQFTAGGVFNLNTSVTGRWDLRLQNVLSLGSRLAGFRDVRDSFEADSNSTALSIRYLRTPFGKAGYQLSLTGGYKTYFDVNDAESVGGALTFVKVLGQGFDFVTQYQGQWRKSALSSVQSGGRSYEQTLEAGFVFSFEASINPHLTPRRSLLNQHHQYVPN